MNKYTKKNFIFGTYKLHMKQQINEMVLTMALCLLTMLLSL